MAICCEKHEAMNTAASLLYTVSIRRRKKEISGMNRMVENESTWVFVSVFEEEKGRPHR